MTINNKFVVSTANVHYTDEDDNILFEGLTLLDSSIVTKLSATDIRGGQGSKLLYKYFHSPMMTITVNDAQWNLSAFGSTIGSDITTGNNIYTEETVTLGGGGAGTIVGTALSDVANGTTLYGWVSFANKPVEKVTFTGQAFTASTGVSGDVVCIRYYAASAASRSVTVKANMIPKVGRLTMSAQLASPDDSANIIGTLQVICPKCTLDGNFTISLKADGVASTAVTLEALAFRDPAGEGGCDDEDYYAKVIEVIDSANWYDDVVGLSILGGDISLAHPTTRQLSVRAIPSVGYAFTPPVADLTFASSSTGDFTINSSGLITTVSTGSGIASVTITAKPTIDANINVTVT